MIDNRPEFKPSDIETGTEVSGSPVFSPREPTLADLGVDDSINPDGPYGRELRRDLMAYLEVRHLTGGSLNLADADPPGSPRVAIRILGSEWEKPRKKIGRIIRSENTKRSSIFEKILPPLVNGFDSMTVELINVRKAPTYVIANPLSGDRIPELHQKSDNDNGFKQIRKGQGVSRGCITSDLWLLLDVDVEKELAIENATDKERGFGLELNHALFDLFPEMIPCTIGGSSGNGRWNLLRLDIKASLTEITAVKATILRCLDAILSTPEARIDTVTYDRCRLKALSGTWKVRGSTDPKSARPPRLVTFDHGWWRHAKPIDHVSLMEKLRDLAPEAYEKATQPGGGYSNCGMSSLGVLPKAERRQSIRRAKSWLEQRPPAISGQGGSAATMRAIRAVTAKYSLCLDDMQEVFEEWNSRCIPAWSKDDLDRKFRESIAFSGLDPSGWIGSLDSHSLFLSEYAVFGEGTGR